MFWFNRLSSTKATVAATDTIALPSGMRLALQLSYDGEPLLKVALNSIEALTEDSGRPTHWAENDGSIQLWPIPDAVYTLDVYGIAELGTPSAGDSN